MFYFRTRTTIFFLYTPKLFFFYKKGFKLNLFHFKPISPICHTAISPLKSLTSRQTPSFLPTKKKVFYSQSIISPIKLLEFDDDTIPPNFRLCYDHMQATSVGVEDPHNQDLCKCCALRIVFLITHSSS